MTAIADFCAEVCGFLNFEYEDPIVTRWVRMAEERLSLELRIADMIQIDTGNIVNRRVTLPSDWRELDFIQFVNGLPLRYVSRDEMAVRNSRSARETVNTYTITGNYLTVGGPVDDIEGTEVEVSYYGDVPQLGDTPTWLYNRHSGLLLATTLVVGSMYGVEDERIPTFAGMASTTIAALNDEHLRSRNSGSVLNAPSRRGFGGRGR